MLTVSTFLFAILAGFYISRLNSRYSEIRELISNEDAYFFTLFKTAKVYGEKFTNKIIDVIDKYYIVSFENKLDNYYKSTAPYLENIYAVLYEIKEKSDESTYAGMLSILLSIETVRNKNSVIAKEKITKSQWLVLIGLTIIILLCLFYVNTNQIFFQALVIIISAVLILILLTIRDLQNLRLGGKIIPVLESGQEVLESMGKLRYYNQQLIKSGVMEIPGNVKKYRLGIHNPGENIKIKIVTK
ncbi:MAG: hypothetical protein A2319_02185 [Candidatus Kerfeldbacteria bacterium RIFOXYB2_FULL_38_14]|uniref:Uncharacterized protein n=1 Tax=Candidatus Kerfeldbacteria bacterium RIFOXYB2_FULL_38_14 TaxID=1798547 RepID=A0A1G2BHK8_9BACT|nr:MAG: hypothetical protein A2319_02185 [Candidatus Kerfeldbacteria bacterium RIFOXYB2_FULL_38_14]